MVSVKQAKATYKVLNVKIGSDVKACLLILWNDRDLLIFLLDRLLDDFSKSLKEKNHHLSSGSISYFIFSSLRFSVRVYQGKKHVLSCLVLWEK